MKHDKKSKLYPTYASVSDNGRKSGGVAIRSKYRDNTKQFVCDLLRP